MRAADWIIVSTVIMLTAGCYRGDLSSIKPEKVWGKRGFGDGRFQKPRAMAIDRHDEIYIVDMTGRIQVFDADGKYLRGWRVPQIETGKPCGLSFDRDDHLLVADTHYFRTLVYTREGELLKDRTIGGVSGHEPGHFFFVTDAVQDSRGNYYVCEYGDFDRVQKFTPDAKFVLQWGSHGSKPGQFIQPRGMVIDERDHLYLTDACNHRIQEFDVSVEPPQLVGVWGTEGTEPGQLRYPYGIDLDGQGHLFIAEFGNNRVQKFTLKGEFVGSWGGPGRREGELNQPWALGVDSQGRLHVLDTYNHRVQRVRL
jgi:sugar lactone lactonase YvrE